MGMLIDPFFKITIEKYQKEGKVVTGIDECARGCIFGPVITASVILPENFFHVEIDDSQKISQPKRKELSQIIKENAISYSIGESSVEEINNMNIFNATFLAMKRSLEKLNPQPDIVYVDGCWEIPNVTYNQIPVIKGDQKVFLIACASILAKNYTDELMLQFAQQYPQYDLEHSKGYSTIKHLDAIRKYGVTPLHRIGYKNVAQIIGNNIQKQIKIK